MSNARMIMAAVAMLVAYFGGVVTYAKIQKAPVLECPEVVIPPCPPCPPAVKVQSIDVSQLKRIKGGFTFAPSYSGTIYMCEDDTLTVK